MAMGGIWTPDDFLHDLVDAFPDVSVLIAPLPGMGGILDPHLRHPHPDPGPGRGDRQPAGRHAGGRPMASRRAARSPWA